jgi:hypothetical protein
VVPAPVPDPAVASFTNSDIGSKLTLTTEIIQPTCLHGYWQQQLQCHCTKPNTHTHTHTHSTLLELWYIMCSSLLLTLSLATRSLDHLQLSCTCITTSQHHCRI